MNPAGLIDDALKALAIHRAVRHVYTETTESPWKENVQVKRKKDHLDVKLTFWDDESCLYGRLYRLLLYVSDVLDPTFAYDSRKAPREDEQSPVWELYKQIWGIYVDARVERRGIPNFYTRDVRRSLFVDLRKDLSWKESSALFDVLWAREAYTHREILQYAENLDQTLRSEPESLQRRAFEVDINDFHRGLSVRHHLERLGGPLREVASEILNFTAYNCRGMLIYPVYFGIRFRFGRRLFMEMIPKAEDRILLTLMDFHGGRHTTHEISDPSDLSAVQTNIKDAFTLYQIDSNRQ